MGGGHGDLPEGGRKIEIKPRNGTVSERIPAVIHAGGHARNPDSELFGRVRREDGLFPANLP